MLVEIHLINKDGASKYEKKPVEAEKQIEDELTKHPSILGRDYFLIGRQVRTSLGGIIDLLGIDQEGNLVIIEIKKGSPNRNVISQIIEYAVWASGLQYEDVRKITQENQLYKSKDLYEKFKSKLKNGEPFNQGQRLYIVTEDTDEKIKEICMYLRKRGIDIKCVQLNFFEREGQRLVQTHFVVDDINSELGEESTIHKTWEERLKWASNESRSSVNALIDKIEKRFQLTRGPKYRWCYFRTKETKKHFAVIICQKRISRIAFRINPDKFDIEDPNIQEIEGFFFLQNNKKQSTERRIYIKPENFPLIMKCLDHAYAATKNF